MLPVIWTEVALADLDNILNYIGERSEAAAEALQKRIEDAVGPLAQYPYLYRSGRVPGTREMVAHPNYIVVYCVMAERLEISAVLHSRQQYPPDDEL